MGQWIRDAGLVPDAILSSTAVRAEATARLAVYGWLRRINDRMGTAYLRGDFTHTVVRAGGARWQHSRVMLVGHNPGMEWLTDFLAVRAEDPSEKRFPTAGLGVLSLRMRGMTSRRAALAPFE